MVLACKYYFLHQLIVIINSNKQSLSMQSLIIYFVMLTTSTRASNTHVWRFLSSVLVYCNINETCKCKLRNH